MPEKLQVSEITLPWTWEPSHARKIMLATSITVSFAVIMYASAKPRTFSTVVVVLATIKSKLALTHCYKT